MKKLLFFISVLTLFAFTNRFVKSTSVVIDSKSKLVINGKTNVNTFRCKYDILKLNKPISVSFKRVNNKIVFDKTVLVLGTDCFDCGGIGINSDFQKLLKSETYPEIHINLKEITADIEKSKQLKALLDLEISGVTNTYSIPVKLKDQGTLTVEGDLTLNIRDFNLEPPKKALGLIVVKDTISINFHLNIKEHNTY